MCFNHISPTNIGYKYSHIRQSISWGNQWGYALAQLQLLRFPNANVALDLGR
jgi:hypothetical protein